MTNSRRLVFPALIGAGLLWGTTVPLSKLALGLLPPAWLAFTRFALAAAVLMIVSRSGLRAACRPAVLISGALGYGGSVVLQNLGIERTSVTHAALLIGATPVLVAVIAAVCGHSMARPAAWAGFALSLAGVAVIASGKGGGSSPGGDGLVLLGQLASATFTVTQARLLPGRDPAAVTAVQLLAAAAATLPLAVVTEGLHVGHASPAALLAIGGLVLAGTVAPTVMFAYGQSRVSADVAGAFLNLEPLVGAVAGTVLFADPVGMAQLAGGVAILAGIGLSSLQVMRAERLRPGRPGAEASPVPLSASPGRAPQPASSSGYASWSPVHGRSPKHVQATRHVWQAWAARSVRPGRPARPTRSVRPGRPARPARWSRTGRSARPPGSAWAARRDASRGRARKA
jgi:O-acetylserine/cysteine efflux transporter